MAGWRKVDTRLWNDEKFVRLEPLDRYLALYVLTGQSNRIGLFRFSVALASEDTGIDPAEVSMRLDRVCDTLSWSYDSARRTLFLPTWWRYHSPGSPKTFTGLLADLAEIPQGPLLQAFVANRTYLSATLCQVLDRVSDTLSVRCAKVEVEVEVEVDIEKKPPAPLGPKRKPRTKKVSWQEYARKYKLPDGLSGNGFSEAWQDWVAHREEIKKPLTAKSIEMQLSRLEALGPERAQATIRHTIERGWVGLREPEAASPPRESAEQTLRKKLEGIE